MEQLPYDPFSGLAADDPARNRNEARDSLFLMADFRVSGSNEIQHLRVRNLSAGGLMAELATGLPQGLDVEFDVRGIGWVAGKVAWSAAGRVGVAFSHPIDPLLARKPVGQGTKTPVFVKPILTRR
ncbi:MAG: PilZ domain-containing protein [Pseudomonadota bacterium]|uniref:PilZ domain-containing protein n=1 Tax=Sphingomonas sp. ERG5 TaxID=1381597 RepID=UPI00054C7E61|nr:PilZ domain-containing protein [Sphingomonas sp. ERG5]